MLILKNIKNATFSFFREKNSTRLAGIFKPPKKSRFLGQILTFLNVDGAACLVGRILFANIKDHKKCNIFVFWRKKSTRLRCIFKPRKFKKSRFSGQILAFLNLDAAACLVGRILFANMKDHKKCNIFFFWTKKFDPAEMHFQALEVQKIAILRSNFGLSQPGRRGLPSRQNFIC